MLVIVLKCQTNSPGTKSFSSDFCSYIYSLRRRLIVRFKLLNEISQPETVLNKCTREGKCEDSRRSRKLEHTPRRQTRGRTKKREFELVSLKEQPSRDVLIVIREMKETTKIKIS
jgi:hypothetical protein